MADLRIAIAGVGPEKDNLEKIAHETQCDAHFLGQLDREESIDLLQRSKIFALISTYEGLSFSLIEAMMLEKRILVSNAPGNQAVITNQVVSDVADMLKLLNSETIETIKLGVNARVKAQKFFCEEQQLLKMTNLITETHR
jgi:glycosyltransferase involved in cell wall biosynthesis